MVGHELSFLGSYLECRSWEAVRGLGFTLSQISHGRFRAEVGRGIVCSICSMEIRLQEALGEARISFLVRCVLVRWYVASPGKFEGSADALYPEPIWSTVKAVVFEM